MCTVNQYMMTYSLYKATFYTLYLVYVKKNYAFNVRVVF